MCCPPPKLEGISALVWFYHEGVILLWYNKATPPLLPRHFPQWDDLKNWKTYQKNLIIFIQTAMSAYIFMIYIQSIQISSFLSLLGQTKQRITFQFLTRFKASLDGIKGPLHVGKPNACVYDEGLHRNPLIPFSFCCMLCCCQYILPIDS